MENIIDVALLIFLLLTALALVRMRNLFGVVMLSGIFSLTSALLYVVIDAVDVAFTEAAVGAGISTVLMLGTLALTTCQEKKPSKKSWGALLVCAATGGWLIYGTLDMPTYGDPSAPIHHHVVPRFIEKSGKEVGAKNIVTSVLASYRGFDTFGETCVVFTAAAGVMTIIGRGRRRKKKEPEADSEDQSDLEVTKKDEEVEV